MGDQKLEIGDCTNALIDNTNEGRTQDAVTDEVAILDHFGNMTAGID